MLLQAQAKLPFGLDSIWCLWSQLATGSAEQLIEGLRTCQGEQAQDRVPARWAGSRKPAFIRMLQAGNDLKYTAFSCKVIEGREESNRSSCGCISKLVSIFFLELLLFLPQQKPNQPTKPKQPSQNQKKTKTTNKQKNSYPPTPTPSKPPTCFCSFSFLFPFLGISPRLMVSQEQGESWFESNHSALAGSSRLLRADCGVNYSCLKDPLNVRVVEKGP